MNDIIVREYSDRYSADWEKFVASSNNGTIFHLQSFLDYHIPGKFNFHHLMFWQGKKLIAVLPGGITNNGDVYWSPAGASYGSLVTNDISFNTALSLVDNMLDYFSKKNIKEIFLIPPPIIYNKKLSQNIEYAMLYRKFDFELHYISHAIHLNNGNNFLRHFDKTARKTIHKIIRENKIRIVESEDFQTFNKILIKNKSRHNVKPTHSLDDMLKLKQLLPDKIRLLIVYMDDIAIAGSLLFLCNSKVVLCFYNMLLYEYENLKPVYLIMYEVVRWAVEMGYEWVDIGVSQDTSAENPMTPSLNLINFKERFGSHGILRSTYHFKF